jgi:hypothetical protein
MEDQKIKAIGLEHEIIARDIKYYINRSASIVLLNGEGRSTFTNNAQINELIEIRKLAKRFALKCKNKQS